MDLYLQRCDLGRLADTLVVLVNGVLFPIRCGPVTSRLGGGVILLDDSTCRLVLELLEYLVVVTPSTLLTHGKKNSPRSEKRDAPWADRLVESRLRSSVECLERP